MLFVPELRCPKRHTDIATKSELEKNDFFAPGSNHYVNFRNLFRLCSVFQFTTNLDSIISWLKIMRGPLAK